MLHALQAAMDSGTATSMHCCRCKHAGTKGLASGAEWRQCLRRTIHKMRKYESTKQYLGVCKLCKKDHFYKPTKNELCTQHPTARTLKHSQPGFNPTEFGSGSRGCARSWFCCCCGGCCPFTRTSSLRRWRYSIPSTGLLQDFNPSLNWCA